MVLRALIGLLIGLALGGVSGTISFFIVDILFPTPESYEFGNPPIWFLIFNATPLGFIIVGLPSATIGAIIGGFRFNKYYSAAIGAVFGLLLILIFNLFLSQNENIFIEEGQTDWRPSYGWRLLFQLMYICGLAIVALIVSFIARPRTSHWT